jgi:DNA (cytosine-5)-methyltransferase 1
MRPGELVVDLFAGGGGASTGIRAALGREVDVAVNHDRTAIAVHTANHPEAQHLRTSVWDVKPLEATGGRPVGLLWASPDCTHFSNAKGDVPRSKKIRSLAWVVTRWARAVRPRVICVENVQEFRTWGPLGKDGRPCKVRKGKTFRAWVRQLERLGYVVDHQVLDASRYGAPTRRRRLFIVARCDGMPIVWPDPTHGPGGLPLRTAAECIDWSLPCPSIFERKRPLAEKTMWRIAQGIRRFVIETRAPFVVSMPSGLAVATIQQSGFGERPGQAARVPGIDVPLGTIMAGGQKHALVAAFLAKHFGDPLRKDGTGGAVLGSELRNPMGTVTARDHHSLAALTLAHFRGTDEQHPGCTDPRAPMPTISAQGTHVAEVRAYLTAYYSSKSDAGQQLGLPLRTVTTKDRLGLVTVAGVDYQIVDIGFRMLAPHELLRAQFGRFAADYDMSQAKKSADKVRLIGNSVCPEVAEALVRANMRTEEAKAA